jgi:hypothetical protein
MVIRNVSARTVFKEDGSWMQSMPISVRLEEAHPQVPQPVGEVHIVDVRVGEPLDLLPQVVHGLPAVLPDLLQGGKVVHELPLLEDRDHELLRAVVLDGLLLPPGIGCEEGQRPGEVDVLVPEAHQVGDRLAVGAVDPVDLLEPWGGDLDVVAGDLDLRDDVPVGVLHRRELVYAAEHGGAVRCDEIVPDSEGVDAGPLVQEVADDPLVQRVRCHDGTVLQTGLIEHRPCPTGQEGQVARVDPDGALPDAHGPQDALECLDRVGDAAVEDVVGVDEQGSVVGIKLAIGLECLQLGIEALDPRVGHCPAGRDAVLLIGYRAGGAGAAADVSRPGAQYRGVGPLGPPGSELHHGAAVGGPDYPVGLGGDQRLVVDRQEHQGLQHLRLGRGGPDCDDGLVGEDGRALRDGPYVSREPESPEILQEVLAEDALGTEELDVGLVEAHVPDALDDLLQAGHDGEAAVVRYGPEEHVEVDYGIAHPRLQVPVGHGVLVEVA